MALLGKSLFLYGYKVTELNRSLDFKKSFGGPTLLATLRLGYYSLTSLMLEVKRAMQEVDQDNIYTVNADRTINGGLENRVEIITDGAYLDILFNSGIRAASSCASLLGYNPTDLTGATTYTGNFSSGIVLTSNLPPYNFVSPKRKKRVFGNVNISASGLKEAIVYNIQRFTEAEFRYETETAVDDDWTDFMDWAIQQRAYEFTPTILDPDEFYEVTLEKTSDDGKGLGYEMQEMLPDFPQLYKTGTITMRVIDR